MKANYQAILSECIERGIFAAMRGANLIDPAVVQALEHEIWVQIDSFFSFDDEE